MRGICWNLLRIAACLLLAALLLLVPLEVIEGVSLCPFYHLTGLRCPTCGLTRAFANALRGNFFRALTYNPLVALLFPLYLFLLIDETGGLFLRLRGRLSPTLTERLLSYRRKK